MKSHNPIVQLSASVRDERSPAIDLNAALVRDAATTFYARVRGVGRRPRGVDDGDLLVVDKGIEPRDGDTVVVYADDSFRLRLYRYDPLTGIGRLEGEHGAVELRPGEETDFMVWGVVTYMVREMRSE